ncbi:MAG: hypothetical protein HKUEN01_17800 [Candidatus Kuenenia stuttgartiensis]|nr:AIPR family protein [Candidatus Kuenenia stuttgartiensis]MCL4726713.1 AIPR family protein [Candidatus Kuenenia stuttgartiensis]GJQ49394.1 MAG: hypothetical protein HKUEN01_17800 [Candidatus Kuenenia stuttgartiensis]
MDASLTLNCQAIVEDMNYMRVLVGRVSVQEIHRIFNYHGDKLLERNIRRYLGLHTSRVNTAIHETLCDPQKSDKFYFYNNGITVVCEKFDYNAFQKFDYKVQIKNMQVINGGQTCKTIQKTLNKRSLFPNMIGESAYVMIRIYQISYEEAVDKEYEKHYDFQSEAVRAGFGKSWQERDYNIIVAVADNIPNNVLEEDPKLLMWYDQAVTRMGD